MAVAVATVAIASVVNGGGGSDGGVCDAAAGDDIV